jgi:hypothetical protein
VGHQDAESVAHGKHGAAVHGNGTTLAAQGDQDRLRRPVELGHGPADRWTIGAQDQIGDAVALQRGQLLDLRGGIVVPGRVRELERLGGTVLHAPGRG